MHKLKDYVLVDTKKGIRCIFLLKHIRQILSTLNLGRLKVPPLAKVLLEISKMGASQLPGVYLVALMLKTETVINCHNQSEEVNRNAQRIDGGHNSLALLMAVQSTGETISQSNVES